MQPEGTTPKKLFVYVNDEVHLLAWKHASKHTISMDAY